jgi:hypothetical protein
MLFSKQDVKDASAATVALFVAGVVAVVFIIFVAFMWTFGFGFFTDHAADRQGRSEQKQGTIGDGNYRIAQYDSFFDQCASVQSIEDKIRNAQDELKTTTDPQRKNQVLINVGALKNNRAEAIRQYNADARKADTKGHFRASDLPFQLDPTDTETTCTA